MIKQGANCAQQQTGSKVFTVKGDNATADGNSRMNSEVSTFY